MSEHIAIWEDLAPETVTWARETEGQGGVAVGNADAALSYLRSTHGRGFKDYLSETNFAIDGAWLDSCLYKLSLLLLEQFNSPSITLNMSRAVMFSERIKSNHSRKILQPHERKEQFLQLDPRLGELRRKNKLVIYE